MPKPFLLVLLFVSSVSYACGLHQNTGFNLITEPGSLTVFSNIISARQADTFNNGNKPDHFRLFDFKKELDKPHQQKINFALFEAINGHYSDVNVVDKSLIVGRSSPVTPDTLLLITELDVLDALANGKLTWKQAKAAHWVQINGTPQETQILEQWLNNLFPTSAE